MNKVISFLKKTVKIVLWMIISFVLLFLIIAMLIQIPAIQTKLVHSATSFISNKTHTRVNVKNISISFPKSVIIEGIYLEDLKKDTLLYAGEAKVNIAFSDLFTNQVHVRSFALENVNLHLNRIETDSLFNYNFLIAAFSGTSKQKKVEPENKSKWKFSVDNVFLKNIQFHYTDDYSGTNVVANLKQLKLKMDQMDPERSIYSIDEMLIENLNGNVLQKKTAKTSEQKASSILPKITANKIRINNSNFIYGDSVHKLSIDSDIQRLQLKDVTVDLQTEMVTLDNLFLSKSKIQYTGEEHVSTDTIADPAKSKMQKNDWRVSVKGIELDDNALSYRITNKPELKNVFDAFHLIYKQVSLTATNFQYSADQTEVSIKKFSSVDQNNFSISNIETDFRMDQHSISTTNLKVNTINSSIDADLNIRYSSLKSLKDSIQFMMMNADLKNVSIKNADIIYFSPQLTKQVFFKNPSNVTKVSGLINGPLNNIKGKDLVIHTGLNTIIKTNFIILGLPAAETANFYFPDLIVNSGKQDIVMMAGTSIPKSIELPENISMHVFFKGQLKSFETTIGMSCSYGAANVFASIDTNENFTAKMAVTNFDLGGLFKNDTLFGPVSLTAETNGQGLDTNTINAKIKMDVSKIYLNKYTYHQLNVVGTITGQEFEGKINLKDSNAVFNFDGLVNLNPHQEHYKFNFNLQGADLQKLHFTKDDIRIGMVAVTDLKGESAAKLNGYAGISQIVVAHEGKEYKLDSLLFASINEPNKSELNVRSAIIGITYKGIVAPVALPKELSKFFTSYFNFSDSINIQKKTELQNFNFEIQVKNHPILSVFLPQLKEFDPGFIQGSFDNAKKELKINASMKKIIYGTTEISNLIGTVNSDSNALNYKISTSSISNSQFKLDNFIVDGKFADKTIFSNISSIDSSQNKKLLIHSLITRKGNNYKLMLDPKEFYLMNDRWEIATDNYIEFGKHGFLIHHLFMNKMKSQINVASVHDQFNDDLNIAIKNFKLDDLSEIIKKDTSLVKGTADGNVLLKRTNGMYGLIADAKISNLIVREVPIGNLSVKAENPNPDKFNMNVNLAGTDNNLSATGYFIPNDGDNSINIKATIQSLSLKTIQAFSFGTITEASGNLTGNFSINGSSAEPDITGELTFNNVFIKPVALNNLLHLKQETIQLKKDGIYFNSFTILDPEQHTAIIDGTIKMKHFKDLIFDLKVNTHNFLVFNTTTKDNKIFYGRMIIDSKIDLNGPLSLPIVNARVKVKKGSNFTFAVPEQALSTDVGSDVVEFEDSLKINSILYGKKKKEKQKSLITGFDISSIIEIDKQATLRLLLDPSSTDSLVVKGEAALSFAIDRSGKMSLTGAYNISDGSYIVSLESVIKRKFDIDPGSTIIWNGDPLDADISVNATYSVRASPIDLVADQVAGLSETDQNAYKQRYPFLISLKLRGAILHPEINFEIQLPPEDKGILGGAVNAKLNMLNEDPSALNKQVFALLVLGRFIQENPLQTETSATAAAVRTTVGKFLSAQLNQWSSKVIPGVELNFDVQSYEDYETGKAEGRTQVDIGVKKQLFNERLTVQVGGVVDVEGEKAKQNSTNEITSDVNVEYKITKDGRYRLKGFRHNQYEGAIEGALVETGAGVLYVRDFNKWKELFNKPKKQTDSLKTIINDTIK